MHRFRDQNVAETALGFGITAAVELQPVHLLEIKRQGALAAVDLDLNGVFPPGRETSRLEDTDGAVLKTRQAHGRVVHSHAAQTAAASFQGALLDEGVKQAGHFRKFADQKTRQIDDVSVDVAMRAGTRKIFLKPPDQREFRVNDPVLKVTRPVVVNDPELAVLDHLFGEGHCRNPAVVVADHVRDMGFAHRGEHSAALGDVHRQRLFAEDRLARARGGDRDLGMGVVRRIDVNHINVRAANDLAPVGGIIAPAKLGGGGLDLLLVAPANHLEQRPGFQPEKFVDLAPRVRMGAAHELVANHADVQSLGHIRLSFSLQLPLTGLLRTAILKQSRQKPC